MSNEAKNTARLSRRAFLKAAVALAGATTLVACGATPTPTPTKVPPTATKPPAPAQPTATPVPPTVTKAPTATPVPPTATPKPAAPVSIKYWYWGDPPVLPAFDSLIKKFNSTHPSIKLEAEAIGWGDYYTKLINAIGTGAPPDAARLKEWWLGEFVKAGTLEKLEPFISGWKAKDDIVPSLWNLQKAKADDPIYMLPMSGVYLYLYCRTDWFKEANLKLPETLDEFLTAAKALTKPPDRYGFGMRGARGGHDPWAIFTWPNGLRFYDAAGNINLNTEDAVKANQWYLDLYLKEKVTPPSAPADGFAEIIGAFKAGKTAMVVHHVGSAADLEATLGDKFTAIVVPGGPKGRFAVAAPDHNVIFKASKQKEAAFTFISWMSEKDQNDEFCTTGSLMPACKSLQEKFAGKNRFYKASIDSIPFAQTFPLVPTLGKWTETIWPPVMQQALNGQIDSKTMIKLLDEGLKG